MPLQTKSTVTFYTQHAILNFRYTNYKMQTEQRKARVMSVWYGTSEYHQGEQWFMMAYDMDRESIRNFAMRDMSDVGFAGAASKVSSSI